MRHYFTIICNEMGSIIFTFVCSACVDNLTGSQASTISSNRNLQQEFPTYVFVR